MAELFKKSGQAGKPNRNVKPDQVATPKKASETGKRDPEAPIQRQWHRRPGKKIDDLLLKRHLRYAPLSRLITQSEQRKSLTLAIQSLLPDPLAQAVSVANYRPPLLVLRVGNASFANRLRYQLPTLTTKLRNLADFQELSKINLRVVQTPAAESIELPPRYLPRTAVESLKALATTLVEKPDYYELQQSILRLSEHTAEDVETSAGGKSVEDGSNSEGGALP